MSDPTRPAPTGVELLNTTVGFLGRFVVFAAPSQPLAVALWVIHTHAFAASDTTPYLSISSPEKRSGKSRLLEVLELIAARAWKIVSASEAVLFRKIAQDTPALLLDEVDAVFGTYAEKTEPLRAVINAGNRRGGYVARCVGPNHDVADFSVFCPKCLAGIDTGRLPETIRDRSIPIRLRRKLNEQVERFRFQHAKADADEITEQITAWVKTNLDALREIEPEIPDELNDRAAEGWEPLLAIAELLGGNCAEQARQAALELSSEEDVEEDSWGVQLLADLQHVWPEEEEGAARYSSYLCSALKNLEDRPWAAWGKGRAKSGFNQRDLARLLRPYEIRPRTVRVAGGTGKGYRREQFVDAWLRYVPVGQPEDES